nr:hypothetical protein [uncultured Kingella sp.]
MIRRWLALTYCLYALRLAALSHFYFNRLYMSEKHAAFRQKPLPNPRLEHSPKQQHRDGDSAKISGCLKNRMRRTQFRLPPHWGSLKIWSG